MFKKARTEKHHFGNEDDKNFIEIFTETRNEVKRQVDEATDEQDAEDEDPDLAMVELASTIINDGKKCLLKT